MEERQKQIAKGWGQSIIEALLILIILFVVLWPARVEGISMQPTVADGDRIMFCRLMAKLEMYDCGDLVVFNDDGSDRDMIKRVIAVEGDYLEIFDGNVYVNGIKIEEDYVVGITKGEILLEIPQNTVFVMGDNREHSIDSRTYGVIGIDEIYGKVLLRFFPLNKLTLFV